MGFSKLDSGIVNSSIWSEPLATRIVWITILAMKDEHGFVATSIPGLQRTANVSKDEFETAIITLESPDKYSRTESDEGRRIEKVEGGWMVLNNEKYRLHEDIKKEKHREYVKNWRKNKENEGCDITVKSQLITPVSPSVSVSVSLSKPTIEDVKKYCIENKYQTDPSRFWNYYESIGWKVGKNKMKSWHSAIAGWEARDYPKQKRSGFKPYITQ